MENFKKNMYFGGENLQEQYILKSEDKVSVHCNFC